MMENRSFDHMLGFLKAPGYDIEGLDGTESNDDLANEPVRVSGDAAPTGDLTPDPSHDFRSVNVQIFGSEAGGAAGAASMSGLAYYGPGNATTQQTHVQFGERWFEGGVKLLDPVLSWLDIGGEMGYVVPHIGPIPNSSIPSIETVFNDAQAPGLTEQPGFMHYKIRALPHYPAILPYKLDYEISYAYYQDLDLHRFSFHKFEADLLNFRPLRWRRKAAPVKPNALRDWFCAPQGAGKICTFGYVAINGLLTLETAAQQQIPFYFQPTLGGADLEDRDTLRGFLDLRFRAPNRMVLQGAYGHNVWGPLGILAFYETGRVGNHASDLGVSQLHHDVGVGITLSVQNRIVMRAYIGFGTGEGSRMNWKAGPLL